ncbi:DUF4136 domain-containing protein [Rufibacter soli]
MARWRVGAGLALLLWVTSCSTVRVVRQEAADSFALAAYITFDFYGEDQVLSDSLSQEDHRNMEVLKKEVAQQLTRRGLTRNPQAPDLLVNLGMVVKEKDQTRETTFGRDAPYYMGQRRYTWKSQEVKVGEYKEGTISLHLVDRSKNELVWQGEVEAILPKKQTSAEERIKEGVDALFKKIK